MTSKHTPGPWVDHQEPYGLFVSAKSFCIASLGDGNSAGQQENARLIAAAPDLLAALEALLGYGNLGAYDRANVCKQARAAIAKAKGA